MKITILNDNSPGNGCGSEHGLSFLVEAGVDFLFDTGPSDIIIRNSQTLGIDLNKIETVVLSHRHYDHSNGLKHLKDKRLICHPKVFESNYRKLDGSYIGMPLSKNEVEKNFVLVETDKPFFLSEDIVFLGQIPRLNDFEAQSTNFIDENGDGDFILDDTGVAIKTENGLIVISGCAHSGICNMVEHAIKVTGIDKIYAVLGGFHLKNDGEQTQKTIEYLQLKNVEKVIPSHCTELPALKEFYNVWPFRQIKSGQVLQL